MTWRELRQGNVESVFQIAMVGHHLITFGRECLTRDVQASAYSARGREEQTPMALSHDLPPQNQTRTHQVSI
jgi:hypothetical protein